MARSRSLSELLEKNRAAAQDQGVLGSGNLAGSQGVGQTPSISGGLGTLFSASAGGGGRGVIQSTVTAVKSARQGFEQAKEAGELASKVVKDAGGSALEASKAGLEAAKKVRDSFGSLVTKIFGS